MKFVTRFFVLLAVGGCACAMQHKPSAPEKPACAVVARVAKPVEPAEPDECPICLGAPKDEDQVDPCGHRFCHSCLSRWLAQSGTCPICRGEGRSYRDRPWITITFIIKESEIRMLRAVGDKLLTLSAPISLAAFLYYCYLNPGYLNPDVDA